jgi:hypothetical protein
MGLQRRPLLGTPSLARQSGLPSVHRSSSDRVCARLDGPYMGGRCVGAWLPSAVGGASGHPDVERP